MIGQDKQARRASSLPIHVRVFGVDVDPENDAYVRRKIARKLAKFAGSIERVTVRASDENGPRGGVDQLCVIKAVVRGLPSVVVRRQHASLHAAIDEALRIVEHAVRRVLGRRRMKPLHRRVSNSPPSVIGRLRAQDKLPVR
jgi:ribosome-associated translation inhibitor RaiA